MTSSNRIETHLAAIAESLKLRDRVLEAVATWHNILDRGYTPNSAVCNNLFEAYRDYEIAKNRVQAEQQEMKNVTTF